MPENIVYFTQQQDDIPTALRTLGIARFVGASVPIKLHMGEPGNPYAIRPALARVVASAVLDAGGRPFLFDTTVAYPGERSSRDGYERVARRHGFTKANVGCDAVIGDRGVKTVESGAAFEVAAALHSATCMLVLSHVKGHIQAGCGGAIKNLALGGLAAGSRWHKIHGVENSVKWWDAEKCTPAHAEELVKSCPKDALKYDEKKHRLSLAEGTCTNTNCLKCLEADRGVGCLEIKPEFFQAFNRLMAFTTEEVLSHFDRDKRFYFNFAMDITPQCNCLGMIQPQIVPDIGVTASRDICAVEEATLDLIGKATFLTEQVPPYINDYSRDAKLHPFQRIFGSMKNPYDQVEYAEELGLGTRKYRLVEVLPPAVTAKMQPPKLVYEGQPTFY